MEQNTKHIASAGRRQFLGRSMMVAAGVATAGMLAGSRKAFAITPALTFDDVPGTGDVKVLNYALALEDLEADLYQQAIMRLTTGGVNGVKKTIVGLSLGKKEIDVQYFNEFAVIEMQHRDFLRSSIGSTAIKPFKYDFGIEKLDRKGVANLVYTAEALGVTAYLGAIPMFATRKYLREAGAIQGTEARHATVLAQLQNQLFGTAISVAPLSTDNGGRDMIMTPNAVLAAVSGFIVA